MKKIKKILLGLLVVLIVIQFFQPPRNMSTQDLPTGLERTVTVPGNVQSILKTACYDCHSNKTNYPWYSRIQPIAWFQAKHIKEGKIELNFSEFGKYSDRRQISKLTGVANSIKNETMPLSSYTLLHNEARLSKEEKTLLIDWAEKTKDSLRSKK